MKRWDCCLFFNEIDILELRLETLYDHVDHFVIVESDNTHLGAPKLYHLANPDMQARLAPWWDKIIYHQTHLTAGPGWPNENQQRLQIQEVLEQGAAAEDYILISDLDEIPNPDRFEEAIARSAGPIYFQQMFFVYWLNCFAGKVHPVTYGIHWGNLADLCRTDPRSLQVLRDAKDFGPFLQDAGWHYSCMGGAEQIHQKAEAIAEGQTPSWRTSTRRFEADLKAAREHHISPYSQYPLYFFPYETLVDEPRLLAFHRREHHDWVPRTAVLDPAPRPLKSRPVHWSRLMMLEGSRNVH